MNMRMPVHQVAEGLDGRDHARDHRAFARLPCHGAVHGLIRGTAELTQKPAVIPEIDAQPLGESEHPLPVRGWIITCWA